MIQNCYDIISLVAYLWPTGLNDCIFANVFLVGRDT